MAARIAQDNQWRFPAPEKIPAKFIVSLIAFEDKNFYVHPGIDLPATSRALYQNIRLGKVVSGGSTLTMQVIRLARKNRKRSVFEKMIEMIWALRLDLSYSKEEILQLYATHAPFGGNIVGLEAASSRYFGRSTDKLSWAECATLAVLPNSPALIYPGRNQKELLRKRNTLLNKLFSLDYFDKETLELSLLEPLPEKFFPIPQDAPHLLNRCIHDKGTGKSITTTIDLDLQKQVTALLEYHAKTLRASEIHNCAVLVAEVNSGKVLCYVGNTKADKKSASSEDKEDHGNDVDVINANRSTGSLLKPYLYASMLNDGELLPGMLVPDIPTQIGGFSPKNYNLTYDGAVPAWRALARSLNIPAVKLLQQHGLEKFHQQLKNLGLTTITRPANEYGMSLILGGAEGKLWDMTGVYASMGRTVNHYNRYGGKYYKNDYRPLMYLDEKVEEEIVPTPQKLGAAATWLAFEAMAEVARPELDASWKRLSGGRKIAWKTGTSFGYRDGWAIGITPDYVVGVWAGNADGEGRAGLTGLSSAAPLLFDVFGILPQRSPWFREPVQEMKQVKVCEQSGYRASVNCPQTDKIRAPINSEKTAQCPYHRIVHLDKSGMFRVTNECEDVVNMQHVPWFVLPPAVEYYYKIKNPSYRTLPPFKEGCFTYTGKAMEMIYPKNGTAIYVPVDLDSKQTAAVFEVAHRNPATTIFWHIDEAFIGSTQQIHQLGLNPPKGKHLLTLVDENGETLTISFEVLSDKK
ncbi:MAG: penicillin-binding protein [Bacteroidetes bacterium]|jgi:penicillin-binding protein 1C|nr:penicillin-binding protein [Bacteroidota bacterium]